MKIRHDINLIFYPNFILNYHYSDQIFKKENRWSLVFSNASAIHFGCGRRTYADLLRKSAALRLPVQSARATHYLEVHRTSSLHVRAFSGSSPFNSIRNKKLSMPDDILSFFGCGRRTRTYDLRVMSGPETFL